MKKRAQRNSRWRKLIPLMILLTVIGALVGIGMQSAAAAPPEVVHFTKGASFDTSVPAPQDLGNGLVAVFTPTTPNPLNMNEGINRQVDELNQSATPGRDGVRRAGGFSAGSVAATKWAQQTKPQDGPVQLMLQGSANGKGSLAGILPDNPLITFNKTELPEHVSGTTYNLRNDGYASCLNQLSSIIECPAGILVGHYCVAAELVPGQCYSNFTGPTSTYQIGKMTYVVGETRNPVAVLTEAGGKLIDPKFKLSPEQDAQFEAIFPQGKPGIAAVGPTPRDILQGGAPANAPAPQQPSGLPAIGDLVKPLEALVGGATNNAIGQAPQAKPIPAPAPAPEPENNPIIAAAAPVIKALPAEVQAPVQQFVEDVVPDFVPQAWTNQVSPQAPAPAPTFDAPAPAPAAPAAPAAPVVPADVVNTVATAAVQAGVPADLVKQGTDLVAGLGLLAGAR